MKGSQGGNQEPEIETGGALLTGFLFVCLFFFNFH